MATKKKKFTINVDPSQVIYSSITKADDYNTARMVIKANEGEYMSVSYEWKGSHVPEFAMNLMGFMQANGLEFGKEYEENAAKKCGNKKGSKKNK